MTQEEYRDDLDAALQVMAAERAEAAEGDDEPAARSWSVWDLPIGQTVGMGDGTAAQYDNPIAKKKSRKKGEERDHHDLLFPGVPIRYPDGFPRADWDQPAIFDEAKPPGRSNTIYNYFTQSYEWHFAPLDVAPVDRQREYHPQGLSVAEERAASLKRRAAHTGPVGALKTHPHRIVFPPILPR